MHLQSHSATPDSFYHLVEIFKHRQEHPLLSDDLHDAKGRSSNSKSDSNEKEDGQKKASSSAPSSITTITTTTTTTGAASVIMYKQFQSHLSLKGFILRSFVKSILLLYLQQKGLASQQQPQAIDSSSTNIKEPHAVAFDLLCSFLGMKLMPSLDDICVVGEEEDDSDDDDEEEDEEEEDWWSSLNASPRKGKHDEKNKSTKVLGNVTEEGDEEAGPVAKEGDGAGKDEGKKIKGSTVAPTTTAVKKKYIPNYLMPQSLRNIKILSLTVQQQLIRAIW